MVAWSLINVYYAVKNLYDKYIVISNFSYYNLIVLVSRYSWINLMNQTKNQDWLQNTFDR